MSDLRCILGSPDLLQDLTHLGALCLEQCRSKRENVIGHFVCAKCALHIQILQFDQHYFCVEATVEIGLDIFAARSCMVRKKYFLEIVFLDLSTGL